MNDYGKGNVLSDAVMLPATTAGMYFADGNVLLLTGFFAIGIISLVNLVAYITRYLINKNG